MFSTRQQKLKKENQMNKATQYGSQLMILETCASGRNWLTVQNVEDCKKDLKNWVPTKRVETKEIDNNFLEKFNAQWERTGKVMKEKSIHDFLTF